MGDTSVQDDATLMQRVREGDSDAEAALYRAHSDAAYRRAIQFGAQPADAEDYVQEAFFRVIRQLRNGKGPDQAFRAYLVTTVRNVATDAHRGQRGREAPGSGGPLDWDLQSLCPDPQEQIEVRHCVHAALRSLPPRWKEILWLLEVEGQTVASIALAVGSSAQSVSALAYRARKAFRQAYRAADFAA